MIDILFSFRTTRQREIKKTASDTSSANNTSASNASSDTASDVSTTNTTSSAVSSNNTATVVSDANRVTGPQVTNNSHSPVFTKDTKPAAKMEAEACKEDKEAAKSEGPKAEAPESKTPITPKGKYELRASTLIPRDYGIRDDDEDESDGKKKVEAVIDLTEDADVVITKQKTPVRGDGSGTRI